MSLKNTPHFHNFRGFKKVYMITVLEGKGTIEAPYRNEHYIYDDDSDRFLGVIRQPAELENEDNKDRPLNNERE